MKSATAKKRIGRPAKPAQERKRIQLGLIVSAKIKALIDEEAKNSGRTQSQVAEWLIERALQYDTMLSAMNTTVDQITRGNIEAAFQGKGYVPVRSSYGKIWFPPDYPLERSGFQAWKPGEEPKVDETE
jgi:hypothetical protein